MTSLQTPPVESPAPSSIDAGSSAGPFRPEADLDVDAFRQALARANFSATGLNELRRGTKSMEAIDLALLRRRTVEPTPFNTLAALFHLNLPVGLEALRAAVDPLPVAQLFAAGLVQEGEDGVRASARIEIYRDLLVCSDFLHLSPDIPLAPNHVLGVGPGAISLAALTPQSAVESVLDLGTGGGIQALLAAPHAERVIATDICPRALNFAAMNARLNKVENIELRIGSFFDPVDGERFDRIIANPPFVISPRSGFIYRDGGLEGDAVSEMVVREAAAHLEEEGLAVMLLNWHHATEDDWEKRPQSWTEGNGCDVRWMHFSDEDPATYAASWLRQERGAPGETIAKMLDQWLEYYASLGIVHIALGAVVMRKHSGRPNWLRYEHIPMDIAMTPCGDQIERIFDAQDFLQSLEDERALLRERFKVHPAHRLEQQLAAQEGGWALNSNKLHLTSGMDFCAEVDMPTLHFLAQLDGTKTLAESAHAVADSLGRTLEEVLPVCFQITKRMLRIGLLVRA